MVPARTLTIGKQRSQSRFPVKVFILLALAAAVFGLYVRFRPDSNQLPVSTSVDSVSLVFEPPFGHNAAQKANQQMVLDIIQNPSSWGLLDKAPIDLTGNALQVFLATLETENHFYHYNNDGEVALSYTGCCLGIGQVSSETTVCQSLELFDIRRNAWCAAKIFSDYYSQYETRAPERALELTVALYKGAVQLDDSGMMVLDQDGLPIIPADDPNDPADFFSQINRVFVDPDSGKSMLVVKH